jgi:hypothetical protein
MGHKAESLNCQVGRDVMASAPSDHRGNIQSAASKDVEIHALRFGIHHLAQSCLPKLRHVDVVSMLTIVLVSYIRSRTKESMVPQIHRGLLIKCALVTSISAI